ncbi:hypothetical protein DFJ74DRAFT_708129 [Hyaloraphidium curvatum]|nr:hypothetical protein DFJ74DRAFT_708129 [Hyaloraphidium curvatum]
MASVFGLIVAGQPVLSPFAQVEQTPTAIRFLSAPFDVPSPKGAAVALFLTQPLPEGAASSIHASFDGGATYSPLPYLLSNASPSAIFRISPGSAGAGAGEGDMMADDFAAPAVGGPTVKATLGLSVEPAATIEALVASIPKPGTGSAGQAGGNPQDLAYRVANKLVGDLTEFALSFSAGNSSGSSQVVSLKVLEQWAERTKTKLRLDPNWVLRDASS